MHRTYSDVLALLLSDCTAFDLADAWLAIVSDDYSITPLPYAVRS